MSLLLLQEEEDDDDIDSTSALLVQAPPTRSKNYPIRHSRSADRHNLAAAWTSILQLWRDIEVGALKFP